jgi:prepilin-type N-terminal cleavage/methylation domain-containing protein
MITNVFNIKKGFTLVETLVAIAVIVLALVGPFLSVQHALIASYVARDELIGNSLAQEGIEYARSIRDNNFLTAKSSGTTDTDWLAGLDGNWNGTFSANCLGVGNNQGQNNFCFIDPSATPVVAQCSGNSCSPLYMNSRYIYTQSNGFGNIQSRFTRSIQLCYVQSTGSCTVSPATNEAKVTATVTWITSGVPGKAVVTDYLQNWLGSQLL